MATPKARASNLPELLMPAGGFDSAIASIEGGADALYFGFSDFSARKQARNFDRLEYRRLLRLADEKGVRLYAAMNTIVLQRELRDAAELLAFLGRFPPDAVIVQDWGLARLIRNRHPGIAIHASTQTALQGAEAIALAREMGVSRVVLPRETSIAELGRLVSAAPDMEFEVFAHGALCYSFSGLCLASGMLLGRSGNRGECAQLCRSYYDASEETELGRSGSGRKGRGFWFSCRDLYLGDRLGEIAQAGAASIKIEGRMKSPEYCYNVARLYRGHLERLAGKGPTDEEMRSRLDAARVAFSRSPTQGWAFARGGEGILDPEYPGHRGTAAGRVAASGGGRLSIDLNTPLGMRDGLLGFEKGDVSKPVSFSVLGLRDAATGRPIHRAEAGTRVELDAPAEFPKGSELRKISSRELDRRTPSPEEYESERTSIPLKLMVENGRLAAELDLPSFDGRRGQGAAARIVGGEILTIERGRAPGGFAKALSLFGESGGFDFRLEPSIEAALIESGSGQASGAFALADAFVPPSMLKREKNRIYAAAAEALAAAEKAYAAESLIAAARPTDSARPALIVSPSDSAPTTISPPPRAALTFALDGLPSGFPFATRRILEEGRPLPRLDEVNFLPLAPLVADRESYAAMVLSRAESELRSGRLCIGLGAAHHIALARALSESQPEARRDGRLSYFIDFNLYVANRLALIALDESIGGAAFAYFYIEGSGEDLREASAPLVACGPGFEPPLFQSLACFLKHDIHSGACPPSCARRWSGSLRDRDRKYLAIVEDCVSYVFRV